MTIERNRNESYVSSGLPVEYKQEYGEVIDLGLATNPSGAAFEASKLASITSTKQNAEYDKDVHHSDVKDLLIRGIGLRNINNESVIFHPNGSYGAGDEVVRALSSKTLQSGRKLNLYVPTYSFPNVSQYAVRHGVNYIPVVSEKSLLQSDSLRSILKMRGSELAGNVVYIDYPNNPSGIADKDLLRKVVTHVGDNGGIPFVDLAFGEVLGDEFRNAIQFTIDRGGICVGSLTKTQGLASLRAGYILTNSNLSKSLYGNGEKLVFGLPSYVKNSYTILFTKHGERTLAQEQSLKSANYNRQTNIKLYQALIQNGLKIAPSNYETPVQIVFNPGDNLYARFACVGIKSESLDEYAGTLGTARVRGLGNQGVRLLTPRVGELDDAITRIGMAMNLTESYIKSKLLK